MIIDLFHKPLSREKRKCDFISSDSEYFNQSKIDVNEQIKQGEKRIKTPFTLNLKSDYQTINHCTC